MGVARQFIFDLHSTAATVETMPHRAFLTFVMPSLAAMVFILLPLLNVGYTSLFSAPPPIEIIEENCA